MPKSGMFGSSTLGDLIAQSLKPTTQADVNAAFGVRPGKPRYTLSRPQPFKPASGNEAHWRKRLANQGQITATKPTISEKVESSLGDILGKALSENYARHVAKRAMAPINDWTPVGNVTGMEEGAKTAYHGLTRGDLASGALGAGVFALNAIPFGGAPKRKAENALMALMRDESGAIRAWHGTNEIFDQFDPALSNGLYYFSDRPEIARIYGHRVKEADLDFRNPLTLSQVKDTSHIPALADKARAAGHDGLIIDDIADVGGPQRQFVAFDPPKLRNMAENDATDAHSMVGLLSDPRPTHALYDVGDVLEIGGQHGSVVSADANRLVLDLPSGRAIFPRNHPGITVAPPSKW